MLDDWKTLEPEPPIYVDLREAERLTSLCGATIRSMIARGSIRAVKPGNKWLIDRGSLLAWFGALPANAQASPGSRQAV